MANNLEAFLKSTAKSAAVLGLDTTRFSHTDQGREIRQRLVGSMGKTDADILGYLAGTVLYFGSVVGGIAYSAYLIANSFQPN